MADYVLHPGEWDNYDVFREKKLNLQQAESSLGFAVSGLESPVYDEAYKLGLNPDFAALSEAEELTEKAREAVERFKQKGKAHRLYPRPSLAQLVWPQGNRGVLRPAPVGFDEEPLALGSPGSVHLQLPVTGDDALDVELATPGSAVL